MAKQFILTFSFLLISMSSLAKTLVISDIDDTIKISHVRSVEKYIAGPDPLREFSGMSELLQGLKSAKEKAGEEIQFAYVSNAPKIVQYPSHAAFIFLNNFPEGQLLLKESLLVENHKIETIKKLIADQNPDSVIMLGDNGEQDSQVYDSIEKYFSNDKIEFKTFIHLVYSSFDSRKIGHPMAAHQNGFVTALDLGLSLYRSGQMSYNDFTAFWKKTAASIFSDSEGFLDSKVFPYWMNCSDYYQEANISQKYLGTELENLLEKNCK